MAAKVVDVNMVTRGSPPGRLAHAAGSLYLDRQRLNEAEVLGECAGRDEDRGRGDRPARKGGLVRGDGGSPAPSTTSRGSRESVAPRMAAATTRTSIISASSSDAVTMGPTRRPSLPTQDVLDPDLYRWRVILAKPWRRRRLQQNPSPSATRSERLFW